MGVITPHQTELQMRKIKDKHLITEITGPTILVDWGKRIHFKNKDVAKRVATKINKNYQSQLQSYNFILGSVYSIYRKYWLFLKPYDAREIAQTIHFIENEIEHAFVYENQTFNTPSDLDRVSSDLNAACTMLLLYATKRKDIPLKHELEFLKTRINDEIDRKPATNKGVDQQQCVAIHKARS